MNKLLRTITLALFTVMLAALMCASASAATTTVEIGSVEATEGDVNVKVPVYIKDNQGIISVLAKITYDDALTLTSVETGELITNSFCSNDPLDLASNPYTVYLSDSTSLENVTDDGVLVYLYFSLDETAVAGDELVITAHDGLAYDANVAKVSLAYTDGKVTVLPGTYTVTFNDWTAPADPTRADADGVGYIFSGWDTAFDNVTSDITVTAKYTSFIYGDVDNDGSFNTADGVVLPRNLAKWQGYEDSAINMNAADLNKDGVVDTTDSVILARSLAKWQGYIDLPYVA